MEDHPAGCKFNVPSVLVPTLDSISKEPESWNSNNGQGQDNLVMEKVGRFLYSFVITLLVNLHLWKSQKSKVKSQKSNLEIFG